MNGGTYHGNFVIEKSVTLNGINAPILDADRRGTVITINAPGVTLRGFEIRNSGSEPDQDHAGITANAPRALLEKNKLSQVLFGIFLAQAPDSVVRENEITSQAKYDIGRKGDSIRLWYSPRTLVENSHLYESRDVVIWYSNGVHITNNFIERGRYGVHLMYCDNAVITGNRIINNSVGIYSMYSKSVQLRDNDVRGQRGPSGYALGFKDTDNVLAENNLLVDNRGGIFLDGTPFNPSSFARFQNNTLAFNDIAVTVMPAVKRVEFSHNTFWENVEQMSVHGGGGKADANGWRENFWSDYSGLDTNGDGIGDTPYAAEKFFENMTDREPMLRALLYSPAAQAIEFAATSFPIVKPQPKFQDAAPRVTPPSLSTQALSQTDSRRQMLATPVVLRARNVAKSYGKAEVLRDVSFELRGGNALALWGPNGAGKTTLVKAMLGLIPFDGEIEIAECSVKRDGKRVRGLIGYVPQEVMFYDWSVRATLEFYARLKRVNASRIQTLLEQLGLASHAPKQVAALSGGLKQRLALALLADPPILLLDEPTANLDTQARADYVKLLAELKHQGKTIVFASHRLEEVEALADDVLWLAENQSARRMSLEAWRAEIAPAVELTLWFADGKRERANEFLNANGWNAHLNGRGTVVVRIRAQEKLRALQVLNEQGFDVRDFEVERTTAAG